MQQSTPGWPQQQAWPGNPQTQHMKSDGSGLDKTRPCSTISSLTYHPPNKKNPAEIRIASAL